MHPTLIVPAPYRTLAATQRWPTRYEAADPESYPREDEPGWSENVNGFMLEDRSSGRVRPGPAGGRW